MISCHDRIAGKRRDRIAGKRRDRIAGKRRDRIVGKCCDHIVGPQSIFTGSLEIRQPRLLTCWAGGIMAVRWLEKQEDEKMAEEKLAEQSQVGRLALA